MFRKDNTWGGNDLERRRLCFAGSVNESYNYHPAKSILSIPLRERDGDGGGVLFRVRLKRTLGAGTSQPENKIYATAVFIADWL